jgi:hypothetical protein
MLPPLQKQKETTKPCMTEEHIETEAVEEKSHEEFAHLVEHVSLTMEEAHRAMRDDDLWVIPPEMRLEATDED